MMKVFSEQTPRLFCAGAVQLCDAEPATGFAGLTGKFCVDVEVLETLSGTEMATIAAGAEPIGVEGVNDGVPGPIVAA